MLDTQKYSECQLVAVINAAAYLGQPLVDPNSEEYERLVDLVGARHGAAIAIRHAMGYLRLISHDIKPVALKGVETRVVSGHPVSVSIWDGGVGFHAILLTNGNANGVKAWNLGIKGYKKGRLTWGRLKELMAAAPAHCRKASWYELDPLRIRPKEDTE